jgi:signal transduction histidine kinase/ActR/RegA family two-component response regulator
MIRFTSLRARLVGTVFLAVVAGWLVAIVADLQLAGFAVGLLALVAAWFGGEWFIGRKVRVLLDTTKRLAGGDLTARTGAEQEPGEMNELARLIDRMAGVLQERMLERESAERALRVRAQQQSAVATLGQFAVTSNDFEALMIQAVTMVAQTLEIEFCEILELTPELHDLVLRAGVGWKDGMVGVARVEAGTGTLAGYVLESLGAVLVADYRTETRFSAPTLARYHGAVSGVTVAIAGRNRIRPFGVLGAHSRKPRTFTDDDEQFLRAVANLLAMTLDRKRAEAERHKRAVFAQLNPTPAIEVNAASEITYSNDASFKLLQETGLNHPRELLPPNMVSIVAEALKSGQSRLDFDTYLEGRTLSWSVYPVPADRVVHCYITDVTERLKMEANLRQADKMLAIGQLAAGVAHDFNNMLTVIQGRAGILLQKADREDGSHESVKAIHFAAERAAGLTRQLLMFSRKNVKQSTLLELPTVVQGMSDMLNRLVGETVQLEFRPPPALPRIDGDRNEIEQVIMNLIVNARDAMPSGGAIQITADTVRLTTADALAADSRPGNFVRLQVRDNGCGMDQATITRIFEPFFTTKEVGKGTGLGLATVYGIVQQHGGWIEVASEVGKGTTFSIYLPAVGEPVATGPALAQEGAKAAPSGGSETILLVEDEAELREMGVEILESFGYQVLPANSGPDALEVWKAHANEIALVLTDMIMPGGMSGRDLAKFVAAQRPALPVIIASGYSMDDISDELSGNRSISFVPKPYNLQSLATAIRGALDGAAENPA